MSTSDRFAEWDAAYVLGALSSAERHEYEEHLATCDDCARAVSGLAVMPGLMAALPADEALGLLDPAATDEGPRDAPATDIRTVPGEVLPLLADRVRRHRRSRRGWSVAALGAAAAVVAGAIVVPPLVGGGSSSPAPVSSSPVSQTMTQVVPSPLSATVSFTRKAWGTRVDMTCTYDHSAESSASYDYGLYVTDASGVTTLVSSWAAAPGTTARTTGSIETPYGDLTRVEVREQSTGTVLLAKAL